MQVEADATNEDAAVRCLECHTVYAATADVGEDVARCPDCGSTGWLAATIPVADGADSG